MANNWFTGYECFEDIGAPYGAQPCCNEAKPWLFHSPFQTSECFWQHGTQQIHGYWWDASNEAGELVHCNPIAELVPTCYPLQVYYSVAPRQSCGDMVTSVGGTVQQQYVLAAIPILNLSWCDAQLNTDSSAGFLTELKEANQFVSEQPNKTMQSLHAPIPLCGGEKTQVWDDFSTESMVADAMKGDRTTRSTPQQVDRIDEPITHEETCCIDEDTEIPEDIFDEMMRLGWEAKMRGQHVLAPKSHSSEPTRLILPTTLSCNDIR